MTLTTGKSGRYRYYKCTRRVNKGNAHCPGRNRRVEILDGLVLAELEGRVFTPAKLREILMVARRQIRERAADDRRKLARLQAELRKAEDRLARLY